MSFRCELLVKRLVSGHAQSLYPAIIEAFQALRACRVCFPGGQDCFVMECLDERIIMVCRIF